MSGLRFLLLEDSLLDTELIHAILTQGGIACLLVQVKTKAEFQTALEQDSYDLILSDYSLPEFDGITALKMAQQCCPDVPFIFVTATMGEEVAIETLKSGATDYVLKQRLERIVPSVQRALREAAERHARQEAERALRESEAQLRQQKEELEQANRIKDEFLAVLSHELRSPLNAILGWSKILRTRQLDKTNFIRAIETIERNAKLQTQLIEDLLDVSRIIRGKLTLRPQPTNLILAIEAAMDTMRLAAQAKSIDLRFSIVDFSLNQSGNSEYSVAHSPSLNLKSIHKECPKDIIQNSKFLVLGDPSRLQQIVWNLLSNAIKFTLQGGKVEVILERVEERGNGEGERGKEAEQEEISPTPPLPHSSTPIVPSSFANYARITVKDTGIGISPDFLPYVFDSFRQADGSITRTHGGLGLGLAIVRHLVELHGGSITAESLGEGQGATFIVQLPTLEDNRQIRKQLNRKENFSSDSSISAARPLAGLKILVVDDDADSRDFVVYALEDCGAITMAVTSASSALEALESFKPNVLISDIGMPDIDGYSLLRQVRKLPSERGGQIPAIALTAYAGDKDRHAAIAAGFQQHLSKPVIPDELAKMVAQLVKS